MAKNNLLEKTLYESNTGLVSFGVLLLRLLIGILLFVAGSGKVFGIFGGYGLAATLQGYGKMGISVPLAYISCFTELIGGFLLLIGLFTRPAAFAVMINMLVATLVMLPSGFMGPTGAQTPFLFLIVDIVILLSGPMSYSIDMLIMRKYGIKDKF